MDTPDILALNCPKCGATLSIPQGLTDITCNYCHSRLTLFQNDSISALQIVSEKIGAVKEDTGIIASELTLKRLKKELSHLLDEQNTLIYAVAHVSISSERDSDHLNAFIPERFRVFTKYKIEGLYNEKPGVKKRSIFGKEPTTSDRRRWIEEFLTEKDLNLLIEKCANEKTEIKNSKKQQAIENYIDQIRELIEINREIDLKNTQISEIKEKLKK